MRRIRYKRTWFIFLFITAVFITVGLALAGGDMMPRTLLSSGGGITSQNDVVLHSAIGQPAVGAVDNELVLCSGYLCGAEAPPVSGGGDDNIYLPFLVR